MHVSFLDQAQFLALGPVLCPKYWPLDITQNELHNGALFSTDLRDIPFKIISQMYLVIFRKVNFLEPQSLKTITYLLNIKENELKPNSREMRR